MTTFTVEYYDQESGRGAIQVLEGELRDRKHYRAKQVNEDDRIRDEIRALFFCLCGFILRPENLSFMPAQLREMVGTGKTTEHGKDLISVWLRYRCNYVELVPNDNMQKVSVIKSLSNESSSREDLSELLKNAEVETGRYLGTRMDKYFMEHAEARRKLGREQKNI